MQREDKDTSIIDEKKEEKKVEEKKDEEKTEAEKEKEKNKSISVLDEEDIALLKAYVSTMWLVLRSLCCRVFFAVGVQCVPIVCVANNNSTNTVAVCLNVITDRVPVHILFPSKQPRKT